MNDADRGSILACMAEGVIDAIAARLGQQSRECPRQLFALFYEPGVQHADA